MADFTPDQVIQRTKQVLTGSHTDLELAYQDIVRVTEDAKKTALEAARYMGERLGKAEEWVIIAAELAEALKTAYDDVDEFAGQVGIAMKVDRSALARFQDKLKERDEQVRRSDH